MLIASPPHHAMLWEPGSVFLMTFLQVLQGSYLVFPKLCLLLRLSKAPSFVAHVSIQQGAARSSAHPLVCL